MRLATLEEAGSDDAVVGGRCCRGGRGDGGGAEIDAT